MKQEVRELFRKQFAKETGCKVVKITKPRFILRGVSDDRARQNYIEWLEDKMELMYNRKALNVSDVRKLMNQFHKEEITFSRMVELLNLKFITNMSNEATNPASCQTASTKKCWNCKHRTQAFKVGKLTHYHCMSPTYEKQHEEGVAISPWETLRVFSDSCDEHELRA